MADRYTLVYDGDCRVCTRSVILLRKMDKRHDIEIVPSQSPGVHARFDWIAPAAFDEAIQLVGPGRQTWQGAAAIEQLIAVLPRGRWLRWIYTIPLARTIVDKLYRWFARNRFRFGCTDHCAR